MNHLTITVIALSVTLVTIGCATSHPSSRVPGIQVNTVDRSVYRDHYDRQGPVHPRG